MKITQAEWLAEAERRFGKNPANWKFQCPCCKHVQTLEDFKAIGADIQSAYQECIGRKLPRREAARDLGGTPGLAGVKSPCDYAAFGLFRALGGYIVVTESGKEIPTLPFAEAAV